MTNILQNNDTQIKIFIIKGVEAEIYSPYVAISGKGSWVGGKCYFLLLSDLSIFHTTRRAVRHTQFRTFTPHGVWQVVFSYPFE